MKVAFLDRDGTIIEDYPDKDWATKTKPVFLNGSIQAIKELYQRGYQIIIITNQYLINDGIITHEQYQKFNRLFLHELTVQGVEIKDIFFCPHNDTDACDCKKPLPGLIKQAQKKYPNINMKQSFFVGDSMADVGIAAYFSLPIYAIDLANKLIESEDIINIMSLAEVPSLL